MFRLEPSILQFLKIGRGKGLAVHSRTSRCHTYLSVIIFQCIFNRRLTKRTEPFKRPDGVNATDVIVATSCRLSEVIVDGRILTTNQQPLCPVAMPAVRVRQEVHQLAGGFFPEGFRTGTTRILVVGDPPDAAEPHRFVKVPGQHLFFQVFVRHIRLMLDNAPVKVNCVEGPIRCIFHIHRSEPLVPGRDKLTLLPLPVFKRSMFCRDVRSIPFHLEE